MPRDPNGAYSLPSGTIVSAGQTIQPSQHNPAMNDIAAALSQSLSRTGQGAMQADLPMNGFSITGALNGSFSGTLGIGGAVTVGGALTVTGALNAGVATFSGNVTVTAGNASMGLRPTGTFGGVNFRNGDNSRSGYVEFTKGTTSAGGQDAYIGYMPNTAGAQPLNYSNNTGGGHNFNAFMDVGGSAVVRLFSFSAASGAGLIRLSTDPPNNADGNPDGTIWFRI